MGDKQHCQSCSRPIEGEADFGTEADGSHSALYCSCCYQKGAFSEPGVTMEQMLERVIGIVIEHRIMSPDDARRQLPDHFRSLARWRMVE